MKNVIIIVLGLIVITLLIDDFGGHTIFATLPGSCDDTGRYGKEEKTGAKSVSEAEAKTFIKNYVGNDTVAARGYFFSKRLTDLFFEKTEYNGFYVYFAKTGESNLQMIIQGGTASATGIPENAEPSGIFMPAGPEVLCPEQCGSCGQVFAR